MCKIGTSVTDFQAINESKPHSIILTNSLQAKDIYVNDNIQLGDIFCTSIGTVGGAYDVLSRPQLSIYQYSKEPP